MFAFISVPLLYFVRYLCHFQFNFRSKLILKNKIGHISGTVKELVCPLNVVSNKEIKVLKCRKYPENTGKKIGDVMHILSGGKLPLKHMVMVLQAV